MQWLIGIDEAGRGPLAGPVAVGAVLVPVDFDWKRLPGVRNSKQLTPRARERIFTGARELEAAGVIRTAVAFSSAATIDSRGIVPAVRVALVRALSGIGADPERCIVLLDGGLRAPARFSCQETIIRGDITEPVISLASVMAKVTRDRLMCRLAARHPQYGFEIHKGYGTPAHREAIGANGLSPAHRASFCTRLLKQ